MTPEWKEAFLYATTLADQLGLEEAIAGSPGWSESGGPWVTPAQAMKKLVWSETRVEGGRRFAGILPKPPTTTGPFQNAPLMSLLSMLAGQAQKPAPEFYSDSAVIAYRVPAGDVPMTDLHPDVTSSSGSLDPVAARRRRLRQVRRPPDGARRPEGVDPVRLSEASGDSRRVPRDRRVQVAFRPAAGRTRPRGERRRPELQEGRQRPPQHGRAEHGVVCAGLRPLLQGGVRDPATGAADGDRPPAASATDRAPGGRARAAHRSARDPVRGEGGLRAARRPLGSRDAGHGASRRGAEERGPGPDVEDGERRIARLDAAGGPVGRAPHGLFAPGRHQPPRVSRGHGLRGRQAEPGAREGLHGRRISTATRARSAR